MRTIASARSTTSSEWPSRRNGLEDLGELRADPDLHTIPVVVLTTSEAEADILRSHKLPANADV